MLLLFRLSSSSLFHLCVILIIIIIFPFVCLTAIQSVIQPVSHSTERITPKEVLEASRFHSFHHRARSTGFFFSLSSSSFSYVFSTLLACSVLCVICFFCHFSAFRVSFCRSISFSQFLLLNIKMDMGFALHREPD